MKTFIDKMDYAVKNWWLSLLVGLLYIIAAIYLIGKKISDVGNDMNNANAREACRYRAESVA